MKVFLIGVCLICWEQLSAQVSKETITGQWICKGLSVAADTKDPKMESAAEIMKKVFVNARFTFGKDGIFILRQPNEAPKEVLKEFEILSNKKWFFDVGRQVISIGLSEENLMQMQVIEGNGFLTFLLFETPLVLRMEKL